MNPERWQQIDKLLEQALEQEPDRRGGFLDQACGGDQELRREVESLLAAHGRAGSALSSPPLAVTIQDPLQSLIGQRVGHYQILSRLGDGGMGIVYKARDQHLDRFVAIKVLPPGLVADPDRKRRFLQEAKAASALKHPNVAHIYEIGECDTGQFIAMEYVEGATLTASRPLELAAIVEVGSQIADALDEAHSHGITHRDIKPSNIMMTKRGQAKLMDFGLAKVVRQQGQTLGSELSTEAHTETGAVMGTLDFMSPEQVLGKEVDHRTDLFSLGVVLYYMATGRLPFSGKSPNETLDRIVHAQPDAIVRFNYEAPDELQRIIRKCLEKDRERRYQSARELLVDFRNLKRETDSRSAPAQQTVESPRPLRRNVLLAVALAVVLSGAVLLYLWTTGGTSIDSLAVLPFVNVSGDPGTEYLSDGIAESLINSLSQLPNLKVISLSSVLRYKGRETDPQLVARDLGVRAVLVGRLVQRGDSLSIGAELVDGHDKSHIWGEQYNHRLADVLAVQEEISKEISEKLRLRLSGADRKRLAKRFTENSEAYRDYLHGRFYWNKRTIENYKTAIRYFEQAIEKDPAYALAYSGLADCYGLRGLREGDLPPKDAFPKAKQSATMALKIDETLAEAHASLAFTLYFHDWDWPAAEREFRRAIELNPNYPIAHQWYGTYLSTMERHDEAIAEKKRSLALDPLSLVINRSAGWAFYFARQFDQAIDQYKKAIELDPNFVQAYIHLGEAYSRKQMFSDAIAELQTAVNLSGGNHGPLALLGQAYGDSGNRAGALKTLAQLEELSKQSYVAAFDRLVIYIGLGDKDSMFEWLQKAYEERAAFLVFLKVEPGWDTLRSDPRCTDFLRRMRLIS